MRNAKIRFIRKFKKRLKTKELVLDYSVWDCLWQPTLVLKDYKVSAVVMAGGSLFHWLRVLGKKEFLCAGV